MSEGEETVGTVEARLRLGPGFHETDDLRVRTALASLDRHLAHWRPESVDLRVSVKHRDTLEQQVTLEIWIPGWHSILASVHEQDLDHALVAVRKVMVREIEEEHGRREPHKGGVHHPR